MTTSRDQDPGTPLGTPFGAGPQRRARITFVGEPRWAQMLSDELNAHYPDLVQCECRPGSPRREPLRKLRLLLWSDVLVRVGAPPDFRRLRDRLWLLASRHRMPPLAVFTYWMGTDVLRLCERASREGLSDAEVDALNAWHNITGAERLTAELRSIGVHSTTVPFPGTVLSMPAHIAPMPGRMTVLSYVPDRRREFYDLPTLLVAARSLPHVRFRIVGGVGTGLEDIPANVEFLGFVQDMVPVYQESSCVVRLVRHDGAGMSVGEGLLAARPVIYSYPLPHVIHVPYKDTEALVAALRALDAQHVAGGIPPNAEGRRWALQEFDQDRRLAALLTALLGSGASG